MITHLLCIVKKDVYSTREFIAKLTSKTDR